MLAASAILLIVSLIAGLVSVPIIVLLRRQRPRRDAASSNPYRRPLSFALAAPGLGLVILMYFLLAHEHLAPSSWLGQRLAAKDGRTWFFVLAAVVWWAVVLCAAAVARRRGRSRPHS